jgi:hypothetical protein
VSQPFPDLVRTGIPSPLSSNFPQEIPPQILQINRRKFWTGSVNSEKFR